MPWAPLEILIDVKKPVKLTKFDHRTCFPVSAGWKLADCLTSSFCYAKHFVWREARGSKKLLIGSVCGENIRYASAKKGSAVEIWLANLWESPRTDLPPRTNKVWDRSVHGGTTLSIPRHFAADGLSRLLETFWSQIQTRLIRRKITEFLNKKSSQLKTEPNTFHFNDVRGQIAENRRIEL